MSSANNTIDSGDEGQAADRERSPAEIAALDKSRSLFGNPSATPITPRDPTPEAGEGVGMETEDQKPVEQAEQEPAEPEPEEPMDTTEPAEPVVEEEVFEKKVVSMDTDEALEDTTLNDTEDVEEKEEESADDVADEDEEEAPKKKPKLQRAASISDDELDDTQEDEEQAEPVEEQPEEQEPEEQELQEPVEQPEVQEIQEQELQEQEPEESEVQELQEPEPDQQELQELEEQKNGAVESAQEDSDESASLQIDESADKSVEQQSNDEPEDAEEPVEEEETPRASRKSTGRRGRSSGVQKQEEQPEEASESPKKRSRRSAAQAAPEDVADEAEEPEETPDVEEAPEDATPSRRGRGRRPAAAPEVTEAAEASEDGETSGRRGRASRAAKKVEEAPEEAETPKRGRSRRSTATSAASATPRSTRKAKNAEPEEDVEEETTSPTRKSTRTPRGRKAKVEEPEEEEGADEEEAEDVEEPEQPTTSTRRSTRAKATPKATPATKRTPARGRKQESEDVETPKRGRAAKKTPGTSSQQDEFDPYDMDTEMEHHPVPLKNIQELQMEVQNFGAVKYAKAGTSEAKYSMTERTAESRISELQGASASKNRRSLADMTPGKEKVKHRIPSTSTGRKSRAKKDEEEEDVEMEEEDDKPTSSAAAATPSKRGKKRKSEASMPSAKKQAQDLIPQLDEEQQLVVDHPSDENEPYAPGARVYAVFNKMFYPAVIVSERDGLGRYKLQFVADKVVKDVPNSGIIPLRDIVEGKKAYIEDDLFLVERGPNDFSAKDWALGQITLRCVDDDEEPTEEQKIVEWTEISFESSEWRDYIKNKDQTATAVVASNITTVSEATRARKPLPVAPKQSNGRKEKKKNGGGLVESRGASTPREEDENELLPLHEKAVGKNIFAGKVFMLTSANRHSNSHVPAMFRKKNLMEFIMQNGGVVTEQLTDFQERYAGQNMLLISDTYYRTHKYLAALANGIPCVHNVWLQKCAEAGELVPYEPHILPAGASLFDDSDQPAPENPSELLEDKVLYVHSTHTAREKTQTGPGGTFVEIWSPMLKLLGATIIEDDWEKVLGEEQHYDVVLVDGTFRDEVLDYTNKIGAKAVTSEWVIQTIILGRAPEADSHPKFDPYRLHHRPRHSP